MRRKLQNHLDLLMPQRKTNSKKLREKIRESISSVLPISLLVLVLSAVILPVDLSTMSVFVVGAGLFPVIALLRDVVPVEIILYSGGAVRPGIPAGSADQAGGRSHVLRFRRRHHGAHDGALHSGPGRHGGACLGAGTEEASPFFGTTIQPEREMVMILVDHDHKIPVMQAITRGAGLSTEGRDIVFSLPVSDVMGISRLNMELTEDEE